MRDWSETGIPGRSGNKRWDGIKGTIKLKRGLGRIVVMVRTGIKD